MLLLQCSVYLTVISEPALAIDFGLKHIQSLAAYDQGPLPSARCLHVETNRGETVRREYLSFDGFYHGDMVASGSMSRMFRGRAVRSTTRKEGVTTDPPPSLTALPFGTHARPRILLVGGIRRPVLTDIPSRRPPNRRSSTADALTRAPTWRFDLVLVLSLHVLWTMRPVRILRHAHRLRERHPVAHLRGFIATPRSHLGSPFPEAKEKLSPTVRRLLPKPATSPNLTVSWNWLSRAKRANDDVTSTEPISARSIHLIASARL
jgi:hypothetical protein